MNRRERKEEQYPPAQQSTQPRDRQNKLITSYHPHTQALAAEKAKPGAHAHGHYCTRGRGYKTPADQPRQLQQRTGEKVMYSNFLVEKL